MRGVDFVGSPQPMSRRVAHSASIEVEESCLFDFLRHRLERGAFGSRGGSMTERVVAESLLLFLR